MLKPKIVVSRCLGFDNCRYNGQSVPSEIVELLKNYVEFVTVCPEVEIGLGVPRDPVRAAESEGKKVLFQPASQKDFTQEITSWNSEFLKKYEDIDGFILKNRSPSCGIGDVKVYKGLSNSAGAYKGSGLFGGFVLENFGGYPVEDEGRLLNYDIRDHFLVKLYAFTKFKNLKKNIKINDLNKFHSENKLVFMAYNQSRLKNLGRILANHEKKTEKEVFDLYEKEFFTIFDKPAKPGAFINVLQHAFGGLSENLTSAEKKFFLNSLEEYRDERIPLSTVTYLIHSLAVRFNNTYLINQTLLNPYPSDLLKTSDSGKKVRR
jgi:uncharacterized protein YbgA (DUF1722 family)/uncharacterized protein YbbK (DUF523 family)